MFFIHNLSIRNKKGPAIHLDTDFNDYCLSSSNNFIMDYCAKTNDFEERKVKSSLSQPSPKFIEYQRYPR